MEREWPAEGFGPVFDRRIPPAGGSGRVRRRRPGARAGASVRSALPRAAAGAATAGAGAALGATTTWPHVGQWTAWPSKSAVTPIRLLQCRQVKVTVCITITRVNPRAVRRRGVRLWFVIAEARSHGAIAAVHVQDR